MKKYLVLLDNSNLIVAENKNLIGACKLYISDQANHDKIDVYKSFVFAEGTGYMRKVFEEIDFVLQCNTKNTTYSSVEEFSSNWMLTEYLDYDISNLSGGWRKFLGLALFTNIKSTNKIFFDTCRHMADDLILLFKTNLDKTLTHNVFFFEYDTNLLRDASMRYVFYRDSKLHNDFVNLPRDNNYTDSNYEQFT